MPSIICAILVVSVFLPAFAFSQETPAAPVLTLDQAISLAIRQNRQIHGSTLEVFKLDNKLAATRTARLPYFTLMAFGNRRLTAMDFKFEKGAFGKDYAIGPIPSEDISIHEPGKMSAFVIGRIDQPLSQQYRIGLNLRSIEIEKQIASEQERLQKQEIIDQVKRSYYSILQLQSALESVEESIISYKEMDRVTDQYLAQQVVLRAQSLEVKTKLAKAEYDALTLRNPLQTQKEQLNSLLGRDLQTEFRVSPVPEATDVETDLSTARSQALERRPELSQARLRVRQAEYDRRAKKSEYIPDVSLSFSYISPFGYGSMVPSNIAGVGLMFNWNVFDWGKKKRELAEKRGSVEQAQLAVRQIEDQIAIDVAARFRKLQEVRQLMAVSRLARELARENLRVIGKRYSQEAALFKDVLAAQASMAEADSQYKQVLLNYWTARADFEKALGTDQ